MIVEAIERAGATLFIKELPKGLQTIIGHDWVPSYGQKQVKKSVFSHFSRLNKKHDLANQFGSSFC